MLPPLLSIVNAQAAQSTFVRTPPDYNPQTGAFTLSEQAYGGDIGKLCLAYDYFVFNAAAGEAVSWQLNSPGQAIYYSIINASQLSLFNANAQNCYINLNSPAQFFNSHTTMNWTSPASGQYAFVLFTRIYYTGPVYLTQ